MMAVRIVNADVFEGLAQLPDGSVQTCVTSPPYWGLRAYLKDGDPDKAHEIGQEPTLANHIGVLVRVFREVRRVLRKDGTLWLNYGDAYDAGTRSTRDYSKTTKHGYWNNPNIDKRISGGLKAKDLMLMPHRLAIALQDDGWWVRSDIIWHKPNPMPESCRDRPTGAHEHIFLLSKAARYFYDADAVRETGSSNSHGSPNVNPGTKQVTLGRGGGKTTLGQWPPKIKIPGAWDTEPGAHGTINRQGRTAAQYQARGHVRQHEGFDNDWDLRSKAEQQANGRNLRNVWAIATAPFPEAHFATFPLELAMRCIKAGCPAGGTVLDPFGGSGTVGLAAEGLGRDAILIELSAEYAAMAERRIARGRLKRGSGTMEDVAAACLAPTPLEALIAAGRS